MRKILKVNYPDRVTLVALHDCHAYWDEGRLLVGGPIFGSDNLSHFYLDLRYWEFASDGDTFVCNPRKQTDVVLLVNENSILRSNDALGYEKVSVRMPKEHLEYGVFLTDGNTERLSCEDYEVRTEKVQDHTRGRSVTAIVAVEKGKKQ